MDIVTCDGEQLKSLQGHKEGETREYIGFKYFSTEDLKEENLFSFLLERRKLIGILKYKVEIRKEAGIKGLLGQTFLYVTLYYMDIRSDKKRVELKELSQILIDEFCNVLNEDYIQTKVVISLASFKSNIDKTLIEDNISDKLDKVIFIRKGRKKYGR